MSTKDEYLAKLKTQLDSWQAEVGELEAKASEAMDDLKPEIDEQIVNLKAKFAEGEVKFNQLADATEEAWEELKVDAEAVFGKLIDDFQEDLQVAATEAQGLFAKIKKRIARPFRVFKAIVARAGLDEWCDAHAKHPLRHVVPQLSGLFEGKSLRFCELRRIRKPAPHEFRNCFGCNRQFARL